MNKFLLSLVALSTVVLNSPIYATESSDLTQVVDPSQHVHIEYNQFNTSDSIIFDVLLGMIRDYSETHSESQLESWVSTEINATYDQEIGAWVISQVATSRYTSDEIRDLTALLLDAANRSFVTSLTSQRNLFCPKGKPLNMKRQLAALEQQNIDKRVDADFYLNFVMEKISEALGADLRAWISRIKAGYRGREYNYRTLWEGRENELNEQFLNFCNQLGQPRLVKARSGPAT